MPFLNVLKKKCAKNVQKMNYANKKVSVLNVNNAKFLERKVTNILEFGKMKMQFHFEKYCVST